MQYKTLSLPERELFAIIQKCQCLLSKTVVTIREVSELIGMLSAGARAVLSAPLHYRRLQMTQIEALLESQSYNSLITLPQPCREELNWLSSQCETMQWEVSNKYHSRSDSNIRCVQSSVGCIMWQSQHWGILEQGERFEIHINILELTAAEFAL